ncbi:D-alanyl-D-alanine carboxypeptidase/D-alanyl-D-alanine-endopeptidase [Streptomyces sp. NPDC127068]|uniref:D-alanyl-D-alanine carboxypeptidase/D-alanyl-D-alanine endopeptidase n=1 Tax=Streptomyces sp. NPDC127068 TaxID=3347127 RepID=UPI00366A0A00
MPEPKPSLHVRRLVERSKALLTAVRTLRPTELGTWQVTTGAAVAGLALAAGSLAIAGPWDASGQRTAERDRADALRSGGGAHHEAAGGSGARARKVPPRAPTVLDALGVPDARDPLPRRSVLADRLGPLLKEAPPGTRTAAAVVDAATGELLWGKDPADALTPASTTKVATAVAALAAAGPEHRITTRTVLEPAAGKDPARLVLVGGGDPTLTARADARGNASLRDLADRTARALAKTGTREVRLAYDTSLYAGPPVHPIGRNDNIATVTALMVDEGRLDDSSSGPAPRSADPAKDAADRFADLLADRGVEVEGAPASRKAAGGAREVAAVTSPPVAALVERMLTYSDNDLAEALARQTAIAAGREASFKGGGAAIKQELDKVGVPLGGVRFADGSGLARADRLSPGTLTALLARAARPDGSALRPALTGLPVAGFTGTLRNRYSSGAGAEGTGLVRAKTGTLTGVHALAGTVVDRDGRLLAFSFMTDGPATDPAAAQSRLDRMAATLVACGCA